jgi:hypothetical protein
MKARRSVEGRPGGDRFFARKVTVPEGQQDRAGRR